MKIIRKVLFVLIPALTLAANHEGRAAAPQQGDRYELTGKSVAIYDLVGTIKVERGTGRSVVVEIHRSGRDASRLRVETGDIDGRSTLRVIFPGDHVSSSKISGHSSTDVNVNDDGTFGRGRGHRVRVSSRDNAHRDAIEADADLVIRVPEGVELRANLAVGDLDARGTAGDLVLNTSAGDVTTSNTRGRLEANTASGEITITTADGDVDLNTASGGISLTGVTATRVRVNVASGSVKARGIRATDIQLESASGNIDISDATTPTLKAETASGRVRVELSGNIENVEVSTASGDAEVTVPSSFGGVVELDTASGDIDVDFPIDITRQRRNHLEGKIGNGTSHVSMSAASGNVRLLKR